MAGTIANAVYLDLRLDLKGVEKGLTSLSGSFDGLGVRLSRSLEGAGLVPLAQGFTDLSGRVAMATRSLAEQANGFSQLSRGVRQFGSDFRQAFAGARRDTDSLGSTLGRAVGSIGNGWEQLMTGLSSGWEASWAGIGRTFTGMINRIISGFNTMIDGINRININIPAWLGGGSVGFNLPQMPSVPALATGGIVTAPTLALVGEAGREAVLPLENNTGWMVQLTNMLADAVSASGGYRQQSQKIELTLDGKKLADALVEDLEAAQARRGRF